MFTTAAAASAAAAAAAATAVTKRMALGAGRMALGAGRMALGAGRMAHTSAFETLVGNTPLVLLRGPSEATGRQIWGKCEFLNPGGSVKDRAALSLIQGAEARGELVRGSPGVIVEGTAGNTGIGLALAGKALGGYDVVICIASSQSIEKKNTLRWAGAQLVEVPAVPFADPNNYVHVAERLAAEIKASSSHAFYANQWDNLDNRAAHSSGTGPEIVAQLADAGAGRLAAFSCAMGTGGTLSGVADYVRSEGLDVHIALTDPNGAGMVRYFTEGEVRAEGSSISEGIGQNRVTGNMGGFVPDAAFDVSDVEMMDALELIHSADGLALGTSSGINVAGAMRVAKDLPDGANVATVLCDSGSRYASKLYSPNFLRSVNLEPHPWILDAANDPNDLLRPDIRSLLDTVIV